MKIELALVVRFMLIDLKLYKADFEIQYHTYICLV